MSFRLRGPAENVKHAAVVQAEPYALADALLVEMHVDHVFGRESVKLFRRDSRGSTLVLRRAVHCIHEGADGGEIDWCDGWAPVLLVGTTGRRCFQGGFPCWLWPL